MHRLIAASVIAWLAFSCSVKAQTGSVLFQGSNGQPAQDWLNFYWDATNKWLGICTHQPEYPLHIVACGTSYATRAAVENNSNGSSAYANWVAENNVGEVGVFGITGSNYNVVPMLQGRSYALDAGTKGLAVATLGNTPVVFGIAGQQTGRIDEVSKLMQSDAGFQSGGSPGQTRTVTLQAKTTCTLIFTGGLMTGGTC